MAKKQSKKKPAKKMNAVQDKLSKSQMLSLLAEDSGLTAREVRRVMDSLERLMEASLCPQSMGQFTLPGLMKVSTVQRPAIKARRGINPFTKEETWFKAKPPSTGVKIRPLKKMKGFAN